MNYKGVERLNKVGSILRKIANLCVNLEKINLLIHRGVITAAIINEYNSLEIIMKLANRTWLS